MELLRIFRAAIAAKNDPTRTHTYAGITNHEFVWVSGGSVEEWGNGRDYGKAEDCGSRSMAVAGFSWPYERNVCAAFCLNPVSSVPELRCVVGRSVRSNGEGSSWKAARDAGRCPRLHSCSP